MHHLEISYKGYLPYPHWQFPHLDYSNSLLMGLPKKSINLMQHVQNTAAKVMLNRHTEDSATECLKKLHQLPHMTKD